MADTGVNGNFARTWVWMAALAVICIIGGFMALINPFGATIFAVTLAGWLFLLQGLIQVVHAFQVRLADAAGGSAVPDDRRGQDHVRAVAQAGFRLGLGAGVRPCVRRSRRDDPGRPACHRNHHSGIAAGHRTDFQRRAVPVRGAGLAQAGSWLKRAGDFDKGAHHIGTVTFVLGRLS